jgi:murein DD-endopeptidase MepM/ murein hydrolase activator NlpD
VEVPHTVDQLLFDRTMGDWRTHAGLGIGADLGETVLAVASGTVERIFHDDLMGTTVVIYHGNGLQSLYANLMEVPVVTEGQWVSMGTPIGAVGTTALAKSGIVHHLHLEIIENGVQVDPLLFLPER